MSNIIPFEAKSGALAIPSDLAGLFENVVGGSAPPHISIKGKVFRVIRDDNETLFADDDGNPIPILKTVVLDQTKTRDGRPTRCRAFFDKAYDGSTQSPACFSNDGVRPSAKSKNVQSLSCETCSKAVKGSGKEGKGTACSTGKMLAVVAPDQIDGDCWSLRLPITSLWTETEEYSGKGWYSWDGYMKFLKSNGITNPAMVETSMRFAPNSEYPRVIFKPSGRLNEDILRQVAERRKQDDVTTIIGINEPYADKLGQRDEAPKKSAVLDDLPTIETPKSKPVVDGLDDTPKPAAKPALDDFDDTLKPVEEAPKPKKATKAKVEVAENDTELGSLLGDWD